MESFFLLNFAVSSSIPVVSFQKDGLFSERTFMQFKGNAIDSEIEDFTLCMRIKLFRLRGSFNSIFSYAIPQMDNEINVGKRFKFLKSRMLGGKFGVFNKLGISFSIVSQV